jgi:hypothetical protein
MLGVDSDFVASDFVALNRARDAALRAHQVAHREQRLNSVDAGRTSQPVNPMNPPTAAEDCSYYSYWGLPRVVALRANQAQRLNSVDEGRTSPPVTIPRPSKPECAEKMLMLQTIAKQSAARAVPNGSSSLSPSLSPSSSSPFFRLEDCEPAGAVRGFAATTVVEPMAAAITVVESAARAVAAARVVAAARAVVAPAPAPAPAQKDSARGVCQNDEKKEREMALFERYKDALPPDEQARLGLPACELGRDSPFRERLSDDKKYYKQYVADVCMFIRNRYPDEDAFEQAVLAAEAEIDVFEAEVLVSQPPGEEDTANESTIFDFEL